VKKEVDEWNIHILFATLLFTISWFQDEVSHSRWFRILFIQSAVHSPLIILLELQPESLLSKLFNGCACSASKQTVKILRPPRPCIYSSTITKTDIVPHTGVCYSATTSSLKLQQQSTNKNLILIRKLIRRNLQIKRRWPLSNPTTNIIMTPMTRTKPPIKIPRSTNRHTPQMRTYPQHNQPLRLVCTLVVRLLITKVGHWYSCFGCYFFRCPMAERLVCHAIWLWRFCPFRFHSGRIRPRPRLGHPRSPTYLRQILQRLPGR